MREPAAPFPWAYTFRLSLSNFGVALIGPLFATYVPVFLKELGLPAVLIGFLSSLDSYGSLLVLPAVAALSDRARTPLGRRAPFMLAGGPLVLVAFAALPHARSLALLLLAMLGTVVGMAIIRGPVAALLGDRYPPAWRDRANGVINLVAGIAWVLAFVAGGALYRIDRTLPFLVMGCVTLGCVGLVALTMQRPPPGLPSGSTVEGGSAEESTLADPHIRTVLWHVLRGDDPRLRAALGALLCLVAGTFAVANFFALYGQQVLHLEPGSATQLLGFYAGAGVLCAVPVGLLTRRVGRRPLLLGSFTLLIAIFILAYLANDVWMIAVLLALAGAAGTAGSVNMLPLVLESARPGDVGTYTGLTYIFGAVGGLTGPLLAGWLVDLSGGNYRTIFLFGPIATALALVCIWRARD
jgi:MFS family permease